MQLRNKAERFKETKQGIVMSPARMRKIALYLKYIAFVLEQEAKVEESKHKRKPSKDRKKDWRIGLNCKPKLQTHPLFGSPHNCVIIGTRESSIYKDGLLLIAVDDGRQLLEPADDWKTIMEL